MLPAVMLNTNKNKLNIIIKFFNRKKYDEDTWHNVT